METIHTDPTWDLHESPGRTLRRPLEIRYQASRIELTLEAHASTGSTTIPASIAFGLTARHVTEAMLAKVKEIVCQDEAWQRWQAVAGRLDELRGEVPRARGVVEIRVEHRLAAELSVGDDLTELKAAAAAAKEAKAKLGELLEDVATLEPVVQARAAPVVGLVDRVLTEVRGTMLAEAWASQRATLAEVEALLQSPLTRLLRADSHRRAVTTALAGGGELLLDKLVPGVKPVPPAPRADGPGVRFAPASSEDATPGASSSIPDAL